MFGYATITAPRALTPVCGWSAMPTSRVFGLDNEQKRSHWDRWRT